MPHKVRSGLWTWVAVIVTLGVVGLGAARFVTWFATRPAEIAWNAYYDELRASGEPVTFADIERKRPTIDPGENAVVLLERIEPLVAVIDSEVQTHVLYFSEDLKPLDLLVGIPSDVLEKSRKFLETHGDILTAAAPLEHLSHGRSSTNFAEVADDPFDAMLPKLESWRQLARLFQLRATVALIDGDVDAAVLSSRCMVNIGASLEDEPNLIPRLVQVAIHRAAFHTLEAILNARAPNPETFNACSGLIEAVGETPDLRTAFELERVVFIHTCDELVAGRWKWSQVSDDGGRRPVPRLIRSDQLIGCRIYESFLSVVDKPAELLDRCWRAEQDALGLAGPVPYAATQHPVLDQLMPSFGPAVEVYVRFLAGLRCGRLAVMAARHRLEHGSLPASLADLDASQADLLIDPFDGEPLRFHVEDDAIVIYSVGPNLKDDGGTTQPAADERNAPDVGFRLYSSPRPIPILPLTKGG